MNAKDYLELSYHIIIQRLTDGNGPYYFATVREFDGCMSHGDSYPEAFENIWEAMEGWIETKLETVIQFLCPLMIVNSAASLSFAYPRASMLALRQKPRKKESLLINMLYTG